MKRSLHRILAIALTLTLLFTGPSLAALTVYAMAEGDGRAERADNRATLGLSATLGQAAPESLIPIDEVNFPDPIFRAHIATWYDVDNYSPGALSQEEIEYAVAMDVGGLGISDLTGIKHFTQLVYLYCNNNNLTSLDVSACLNLKELYCGGNLLTSLDITGLDGLEYLNCDDNQFTSLTVAGHSGLKSLSCNDNLLTGLDVRGCDSLEYLSCIHNYIPAVTDIIGYSNPPTTDFFFDPQLDPDITYYSIFVNGAKFKVTVPGELVRVNDIRRITGLRFGGWTVEGGNLTLEAPESNCITFFMPAEDVRLSTSFEELPPGHNAIWVVTEGVGNVGLSAASAAPGEEITLTAFPIQGYTLAGWQGSYFTAQYEEFEFVINGDRFIMPEGDVVIAAFFEEDDGEGNEGGNGAGPGSSASSRGSSFGSSKGSSVPNSARTVNFSAAGQMIVDASKAKDATTASRDAGRQRTRITNRGTILVTREAWSVFGNTPVDFDTMNGNTVQVRQTPRQPSAWNGAYSLSGWVQGAAVDDRRAFFEKWFQNPVRVIHLDQMGRFPQEVEVAAKVDLNGMDTGNLVFYSYNKDNNSYTRIQEPSYRIDANGYLRFTTSLAGDIVVSEGTLRRH